MGAIKLAPGETEQEVKNLWSDLVQGNSGFSVSNEIPARMSGEMIVKPAQSFEGFKAEAFSNLIRLISTPTGRQVTRDVMAMGAQFPVVIRPRVGAMADRAGQYIPQNVDNTKAGGTGGAVEMPLGMSDTKFKVHHQSGTPIIMPGFVMLGHELGHAANSQRAIAQNQVMQDSDGNAISKEVWADLEEKNTIEHVENQIRAEHSLPFRFGVTGEK